MVKAAEGALPRAICVVGMNQLLKVSDSFSGPEESP